MQKAKVLLTKMKKIISFFADYGKGVFEAIQLAYILLFSPKSFEKKAIERMNVLDTNFAARPEEINAVIEKTRKMRHHILQSLCYVIFVVIIAVLLSLSLRGVFHLLNITVVHGLLNIMRVIAYLIILWGVLSSLGHHLRTWNGDSLPEILDGEWHKGLYALGVLFLILSYSI